MRRIKITIFLLLTLCQISVSLASDLAKEKRWADQIVDAILDGEAITLNDGKHDFLGILTEAEDKVRGGAIVLHGSGVHPDWPQVVYPLRTGLVGQGWTTLSLQLPILANEAEYKEYIPIIPDAAPRIKAGVEHLLSMGLKNVVVIAHSMGTRMAGYALAKDAMGVNAYVAIGSPEGTSSDVSKINIPILDLYGENDLEGVIKDAKKRRSAAAKNAAYQQTVTKGADHFFNEQEEALIKVVADWLADKS